MASKTESGHAVNQALLNELIEILDPLAEYDPSNKLITKASLKLAFETAKTLQGAVNEQEAVFKTIENGRREIYMPVKKLVRRVVNLVSTSGATDLFMDDVKTIGAKVLGERSSKAIPSEKDPTGTSSSQQGYINVANNMERLIKTLETEKNYNPKKAEFSLVNLTILLDNMQKSNLEYSAGMQPYNNALIARNKHFYNDKTGLTAIGQLAKNEVRGTFGFQSQEFRLVSKLKFKNFGTR